MRLTRVRALAAAVVLAAAGLVIVARQPAVGVLPVPARAPSTDPAIADGDVPSPRSAAGDANAPIRIAVVDARGAPVVGALVALVSLADGTSDEASTGSDGEHAFASPAGRGGLRVLANGDGFLPYGEDLGARDSVRIVLRRAPRVRVTAREKVGNEPLLAFVATVLPASTEPVPLPIDPPPGSVRTENGIVDLVAVEEGPHDVVVFAAHRRPERVRVELRADTEAAVEAILARGIALRGRVRDHGGVPVAEAAVMLQATSGVAASAITSADGSFAFAPMPEGEVALLVQPETQPFLRVPSIALHESEPEPFFELQLPPGCELRGQVVPWVAGQQGEVVVAHEEGPIRRVPVDADTGAFVVRDLHGGVHRVELERTEREWRNRVARALPPAVERVVLEPGKPLTVEVADRVPSLARVRGRVVPAAPARGLVVRAFSEGRPMPVLYEGLLRASVPDDGSFAIEGLLPGRWRLQVMRGDDVLAWQAIELGPAQALEVVLRRP